MKNERLNKILKDILSEFGYEPNAVAMGMLDSKEHRLVKMEMLSNILDIVSKIEVEDNDEKEI